MKFDEAIAAITKLTGATPDQSAAIRDETVCFAAWNNLTQADAGTLMHDLVVHFSATEPPIRNEGTDQS